VTVRTGYQVLAGTGPQAFSAMFNAPMYWASAIAVFKPST
jgi:hypothetical protein